MEIRNVLSSVYKNDDKFKSPSGKNPDVTKKTKLRFQNRPKLMQTTGDTKTWQTFRKNR